jgi:hypothetical protein
VPGLGRFTAATSGRGGPGDRGRRPTVGDRQRRGCLGLTDGPGDDWVHGLEG